jgi:hypothetical protein
MFTNVLSKYPTLRNGANYLKELPRTQRIASTSPDSGIVFWILEVVRSTMLIEPLRNPKYM